MPSRRRSPVRKKRGRCRGTRSPVAPSLLDALIDEAQRTNQSKGAMAGVPVRLKITDAPTKPTGLVLTVNPAELDALWDRLARLDPQADGAALIAHLTGAVGVAVIEASIRRPDSRGRRRLIV